VSDLRPSVGLRARASVPGHLLAETAAAVRVDRPDGSPQLWFPRGDVAPSARDGRCRVLAGEGPLAGHVAFDADEVLLEIVEGDEREVTRTRFPCWGDAADLIAILDVQRHGAAWSSASRGWWAGRPVIEASQMLAQTLVAGARSAREKHVVSASITITRPVDALAPYAIELDEVSHGRTFAAARTSVTQGGRTCAFGTLLLDAGAPDVMHHADPPPRIPGPLECPPYDMGVTGRELRIVDGAYTGDPDAPAGPPELSVWVRFREVPVDPPIHAALLAQLAGHFPIAAAMRPHAGIGQDQAHRTLSTAINAISLSIHGDVRADRWMLYHHRATFAGAGMTHSACRVHDEDGGLLASFSVDAMVRAFTDPTKPTDERRSL
jgi:acyl-CoA thioesterase-2